MQPITLLTGPLEVNTYIMLGARAGECFIVDPSDAALVQDTIAPCRNPLPAALKKRPWFTAELNM